MQLDRDLLAREAGQEYVDLGEMFRTVMINLLAMDRPRVERGIAIVPQDVAEAAHRIRVTPLSALLKGGWTAFINDTPVTRAALEPFERLISEAGLHIAIERPDHISALHAAIDAAMRTMPVPREIKTALKEDVFGTVLVHAVTQAMARRGMVLPVTIDLMGDDLERNLLQERDAIAARLRELIASA
jgi:hypothetical protein